MTKLELPPLFDEPGLLKEVPREPPGIVVSLSGSKDSVASLPLPFEIFGPELVAATTRSCLNKGKKDLVGNNMGLLEESDVLVLALLIVGERINLQALLTSRFDTQLRNVDSE